MFSNELTGLLIQVVQSWQVIAVTVVLVLYMFLVNYAARTHHRPSYVSKSKPKKSKKKEAPAAQPDKKEAPPKTADEELGLTDT